MMLDVFSSQHGAAERRSRADEDRVRCDENMGGFEPGVVVGIDSDSTSIKNN